MIQNELVGRNIVILFDEILTDELVRLSSQINQKVPSKVVLNTSDIYPHLTVYSAKFPPRNVERIKEFLSSLVKNTHPFILKFSRKSAVVGTIFIEAVLSKELQALHEKIVDKLNSLREGAYDEKELELPGLTRYMKQSLINYGMWAAKKEYLPHITIARPFDSQKCDEALHVLPEKINYSAKVISLSLVETGSNGTCKRVIETFLLDTLSLSSSVPSSSRKE